ncbi:hypothetical protein T310_4040 [Rasamsonia emersonii CBS 393.64]|uniref:SNF2 family helicase n=1 Tax=Rasamsonia emersonii (strain ATCC 16479 / CBS 393.64 / IMI 116815) TaxID=1408163 RepID=A0A0F4YVJ6_RASE3|nr:hypothetical protein T310_4040 [Rasamsonia emersonii CBS 393.64]KKA21876.1 hypothetical protein T310_4040 [Rasamsonia emersonii CBS 393.64]
MARDARKRKADVVDLTASDQEDPRRPRKIGRGDQTNAHLNVSNGQRFGEDAVFIPLSQASQISLLDEDDAGAIDLIQGSQDFDDAAYSNYELYDDLHTKIVGVRYYQGHATLGEHVILKREPGNPYDSNAIRVDNVMGQQIGHIPRNMAARLAKYMDSKSLLIEGILTGMIGAYDCPIVLKLYGPSEPRAKEQVKSQMQIDKLPIGEVKRREREQRRLEKEREKQRKEAEKRARAMAKAMGQGMQWNIPDQAMFANLSTPDGMGEGASLEDLINQSSTFNPRQMVQAVEKFGVNEEDLANMPMAEIPPGLATQLLSYQRQGLAWMLEKESPRLPAAGSQDVVQLWKREGNKYRNIATNFCTTKEPPLASGGILADDMGLGKTIQIISLILANPQPRTPESTRTTLIISPVGVMSNWKNQIEAHVKDTHALHVLVYHGAGKKEAANLGQYDVVITSYGALAMEYNPNDKSKKIPAKGLYSIHWRRVVLDEGHTIRNPRSKGALAACNLRADSRWTLTGTPIINSLRDLYSQIRFLRLSGGLEDLAVFNSVLIRPLSYGDPESTSLLQTMMAAICLRRRKDMSKFWNLPISVLPSTDRDFRSEAKGMLSKYQSSDKHGNATYSHILEVILRLRQVCNHWALCKNRVDKLMALLEDHKVIDLTPENVKALQEMLQLRIESQETCSICLDTLEQPVITACAHAFDRSCIEQVIERQHKCPLCRAEIKDTSALVPPASEMGEDTGSVDVDPDAPSSKIEALIKILTAQGQAPDTKTVVFSQWTSFLDILEPHLKRSGIVFTRIDGKMPSAKRDNAITVFSTDPDCKVLLASLNVCSVGLNLVAANQVILADSWWAPAIEDQAMDRVYRLGQTRETTVWRLVMEDSIEDRVLEIQETKRQLSMAALRETGKKKRAEDTAARIADLEKLLR